MQAVPELVARARRPVPAARQRRHEPVQAVLPGQEDHARDRRHLVPEVRPHQRHRHHRLRRPPCELLRDARQLLLRRRVQGAGLRLGPRAVDRRLPPAHGAPALHRVHRRRRDLRHLAQARRGRGPHLAPGRRRQLLGGGPHRPVRPVLRDLLRHGRGRGLRAPRLRPGSSSTGPSCSRSSTARRTAPCRSCRTATSTPAWASSA